MKRIALLFLMILTFGIMVLPASAQNTFTVADGPTPCNEIPFFGYWMDMDQHNQIIYPESLLTDLQGQEITKMEFYMNNSFSYTSSVIVKLGISAASQFNSNSLDNTTALTVVYSGNVVTANNMLIIEFTTPFLYTGGNLLFDWSSMAGNYYSSTFYGIEQQNASIFSRFSAQTKHNFLPKTTFTVNTPSSCTKPSYLFTSNITTSSATINWVGGSDVTTYRVQYMLASEDNWDNATTLTTNNLMLNLVNLQSSSTYKARVQSVCSDGTFASSLQVLIFSTLNTAIDLPYVQNFETSPATISDFTFLGMGSNQWAIGSATFKPSNPSNPNETGHSMYISNDNGTSYYYDDESSSYAYAILDVTFDNASLEYRLSFDYKTGGEILGNDLYDFFSVFMVNGNTQITPGQDIPGAVTLLEGKYNVPDWSSHNIILNNVAGTSKKIVFYWENDGGWGTQPSAAIDNIMIGGSSCGQPTMLSASDITTNSATLHWSQSGEASSWTVFYKAASEEEYDSVSVSGTPTCTISNLSANTHYTFYVVAECDDSSIAQSVPSSFRTQCGELTSLPYTADFNEFITDNGSLYYPCWSRLTSNPSHKVYVLDDPTYSHDGSAGCLDFGYTPSCQVIAIMPELANNIPVNTLMLDFYLDKTGETGTFEVGVMTDPTDASTFQLVTTVNSNIIGNNAQSYERHVLTLASYNGTGKYIAFRVSNTVSCGYRMDDLTVSYIPACMAPINFHEIQSSDNSVTLMWTETGSAHSWNVKYGLQGFDPETEGELASANHVPFSILNLQTTTTYDFYVQANCGSDQSEWVGPVTTTTGTYTMGITGSDTIITCNKYIYDNGGPDGDHSEGCNYTLVIYPATQGSGLLITGTVSTSDYEYYEGRLTIYAGAGTTGDVLGSYSGEQDVAIAYDGPVTLKFVSYEYDIYNAPGFELLVQCVSCLPPTNVTVTPAGQTSATVSWNGNATDYALYLDGTTSGYYTTSANTYTITDLEAGSPYSVSVRSICGSDTSLPSLPAYFSTPCGTFSIPWSEDFESYPGTGAQPFVCWETPITSTEGSPFVNCGDEYAAHSGSNSAKLSGISNMLVLPEFSNNVHDLRLSFWATAYFPSYTTVEIGVITDVNNPNTFEYVCDAGIPGEDGIFNRMGPFDFAAVSALDGRIAIRFTKAAAYYTSNWNLDDFTVEMAPECPSPVKNSVTASNIDGHNATISFIDNVTSHHAWIVFYKAENESSWSTVPTNTTSASLTNLTPNTNYQVYVITNCGTMEDNPDSTYHYFFMTDVPCPSPSQFSSSSSQTESILSWFGNADSYLVSCGNIDTTVTGNTVTLTGLTPATLYSVTITANCGSDGTSEPSEFLFQTSCEVVSSFPYSEGFEDATLGCWSQEVIMPSPYGDNPWTIFDYNQHSGSQCLTMDYTPNTSSRLISPIFDLTNLSNPTLSFYHQRNGYGDNNIADTIAIFYRTALNENWVRLEGYQQPTNGYQLDSLALPNASATYQFSIVGYGIDGANIYLDDITVYGGNTQGSCLTPTNLFVPESDVTSSTAYVTWTAGGDESEWSLQYKKGTTTNWSLAIHTTNPYYTLSNLQANTPYHVRVKAICSDTDESDWTNLVSFRTDTAGQQGDPTVVTMNVSNITVNSAMLYGVYSNPGNVEITAKGFEWTVAGNDNYSQIEGQGTGSIFHATLDNLAPSTTYNFKAFITFNGTTIYGNVVTFTTDSTAGCDAPTGLYVSAVANHSIDIEWDNNPHVSSWNVRYRVANGTWNTASNIMTNSYAITGMEGSTDYEIQVQANCGDDDLSAWSASVTAHTTNVGIVNHLENSVTLFPNPAMEYVDVRIDGDVNVTTLDVYDVYGKLIRNVNMIDNPTRINVSSLANGIYFVRVTTDAGMVTKTFVKK
jgi:hypothetical protein